MQKDLSKNMKDIGLLGIKIQGSKKYSLENHLNMIFRNSDIIKSDKRKEFWIGCLKMFIKRMNDKDLFIFSQSIINLF